jgi:hypothetical protein
MSCSIASRTECIRESEEDRTARVILENNACRLPHSLFGWWRVARVLLCEELLHFCNAGSLWNPQQKILRARWIHDP